MFGPGEKTVASCTFSQSAEELAEYKGERSAQKAPSPAFGIG